MLFSFGVLILVYFGILVYIFLVFLLILGTGERFGYRFAVHIPHSGESGSKAKAQDIPCSRKDKPYVFNFVNAGLIFAWHIK